MIAITGWTRDEDKVKAYEAGFDYYLIKPISLDTIDRLLKGISAKSFRDENGATEPDTT